MGLPGGGPPTPAQELRGRAAKKVRAAALVPLPPPAQQPAPPAGGTDPDFAFLEGQPGGAPGAVPGAGARIAWPGHGPGAFPGIPQVPGTPYAPHEIPGVNAPANPLTWTPPSGVGQLHRFEDEAAKGRPFKVPPVGHPTRFGPVNPPAVAGTGAGALSSQLASESLFIDQENHNLKSLEAVIRSGQATAAEVQSYHDRGVAQQERVRHYQALNAQYQGLPAAQVPFIQPRQYPPHPEEAAVAHLEPVYKKWSRSPASPVEIARVKQQYGLAQAALARTFPARLQENQTDGAVLKAQGEELDALVAQNNAGQLSPATAAALRRAVQQHQANVTAFNQHREALVSQSKRFDHFTQGHANEDLHLGMVYPEEVGGPGPNAAVRAFKATLSFFQPVSAAAARNLPAARRGLQLAGDYPPLPELPANVTGAAREALIRQKNDLVAMVTREQDPTRVAGYSPVATYDARTGQMTHTPGAAFNEAALTPFQRQLLPIVRKQVQAELRAREIAGTEKAGAIDAAALAGSLLVGGLTSRLVGGRLAARFLPLLYPALEAPVLPSVPQVAARLLAARALPVFGASIAGSVAGGATGAAISAGLVGPPKFDPKTGKAIAPTPGERAAYAGEAALRSVPPSALIGTLWGAASLLGGTLAPFLAKSHYDPETGPATNAAFTAEAEARAAQAGYPLSPEESGRFGQRFGQIQRAPTVLKPKLWRDLARDWNTFIQQQRLLRPPGEPGTAGTAEPGGLGPPQPQLPGAPRTQFDLPETSGPLVRTPAGQDWDLRTRPVEDIQTLHDQFGQLKAAGQLTPEQDAEYGRLDRWLQGHHDYLAQQALPGATGEAQAAIHTALTAGRGPYGLSALDQAREVAQTRRDFFLADELRRAIGAQSGIVTQAFNSQLAPPGTPGIEAPLPPLFASVFRTLPPERLAQVPAPARRVLLLQDLNNSIQALEPGAQPFFRPPQGVRSDAELRALADSYYRLASLHLSSLFPSAFQPAPPPSAPQAPPEPVAPSAGAPLTDASLVPGTMVQFPNGLTVQLQGPTDAGGLAFHTTVMDPGHSSYVAGSTATLARDNLIAGGTLVSPGDAASAATTTPAETATPIGSPSGTPAGGAIPTSPTGGILPPTGTPSPPSGLTTATGTTGPAGPPLPPGAGGVLSAPPSTGAGRSPGATLPSTPSVLPPSAAASERPLTPADLRPGAVVKSAHTGVVSELKERRPDGKWQARVIFVPATAYGDVQSGSLREIPESALLEPGRYVTSEALPPEELPTPAAGPAPPEPIQELKRPPLEGEVQVTGRGDRAVYDSDIRPGALVGFEEIEREYEVLAEPVMTAHGTTVQVRDTSTGEEGELPIKMFEEMGDLIMAAPPLAPPASPPVAALPALVPQPAPPSPAKNELPRPVRLLIDALLDRINARMLADEPIFSNNVELEQFAAPLLGGSRAAGTYTAQTVYNALEAAVNRYVVEQQFGQQSVGEALQHLQDLLQALPTQTLRAGDKDALQQFSTPPTLALLAAYALRAKPGENLLEPSAGTGSLLALAQSIYGAELAGTAANELDSERRAILHAYFTPEVYAADARYLNATLPHGLTYDLILMNPPFSAAKGQRAKNTNEIGFEHVEQALKRLKEGGRLVAILGRGASFEHSTAMPFWNKVTEQYHVRANAGLPGKDYQKYGTSFATQLVVIDNTGPTPGGIAAVWAPELTSVEAAIEGLNERGILVRSEGAGKAPAVGVSPAGEPGARGAAVGVSPGAGRAGGGRRTTGRREVVAVPAEPGAAGSALPAGVSGTAPGTPSEAGAEPRGAPPHGDLRPPGDLGEPGAAGGEPAPGPAGGEPDRHVAGHWVGVQAEQDWWTLPALRTARREDARPGAVLRSTKDGAPYVVEIEPSSSPQEPQGTILASVPLAPHGPGEAWNPLLKDLDQGRWELLREGAGAGPEPLPPPLPPPVPPSVPRQKPAKAPAGIQPEERQDVGDQYVSYLPAYVLEGRPHPAIMVETRSLAAVDPPPIIVTHSLKEEALYPTAETAATFARQTGKPVPNPEDLGLSNLQLEAVLYAKQRHETILPSGARGGLLLGDGTGCIAAGTRIYDPTTGVETAVELLAEAREPHVVLALTPEGLQPHWAEAPFVKGVEKLYRVTLASGRQVTVTGQHRFLTPKGWFRIDDGLAPGHFLACAGDLPECSSESSRSTRGGDDPHWPQRVGGSPDDCRHDRRCGDGPLLGDPGNDPGPLPSPTDALARTRSDCQTDGPATLSARIPLAARLRARLSRNSSSPAASRGRAENTDRAVASSSLWLAASLQAKRRSRRSTSSSRSTGAASLRQSERLAPGCEPLSPQIPCGSGRPAAGGISLCDRLTHRTEPQGMACPTPPGNPPQSVPGSLDPGLRWQSSPYNKHITRRPDWRPFWDHITSVTAAGEAVYYDFHVPGPENYVAEGIIHHNSGKGRSLAGIAVDGWENGNRRIVWFSARAGLMDAAKDDLAAIGYGHIPVKLLNTFPGGEWMPDDFEGIVFATYATLTGVAKSGTLSGTPRRVVLERWLAGGTDAAPQGTQGEGSLVLMDESHRCKNAQQRPMGPAPSQTAIEGMKLQANLPLMRVVYSSATAMTELDNMAYLQRLGLWGPGTPWPGGFNDFAVAMGNGGRGYMEMIARDMKARGMYLAREISFKDPEDRPEQSVEFRQLQHSLTPEDARQYALVADAWQVVLQNMEAALDITGGDKSARAKMNAIGAFWSDHQRFFRRFLTALKLPTLFADIDAQLAANRSVVISLIGTNETATDDAVRKAADEGLDLDELDLTPIQGLVRLVERAFPVQKHGEKLLEGTNQTTMEPLVDAEGNPVLDPEAVALREALLERLAGITERLPGNPLDEILFRYGHGAVAEITGRKKRLEMGPNGETIYVSRGGANVNVVEKDRFNAGEKRVALISTAANEGISLQAGRRFANQQRRVQYMFELNWSADQQMQANGRTHRSNQVSAPELVIVNTNAGGETRFAATIARRLASLGALTRGQREATGAGGALDQFDYENDYGRRALELTYQHILRGGQIEGLANATQALRDMGLLKKDQYGYENMEPTDRTHITRFFNRLLSLDVARQNPLFEAFVARFAALVQHAQDAGEFDYGVQDIRGGKLTEVGAPQRVSTDPATGAETLYHHVTSEEPAPLGHLAEIDRLSPLQSVGFFRRVDDSSLVYVSQTQSPVNPYRIWTPANQDLGRLSPPDLGANFLKVPDGEVPAARAEWAAAEAAAPATVTRHYHLIAGAVLPVFDRLKAGRQERFEVKRAKLAGNRRLVGISLQPRSYKAVLKALGATSAALNPAGLYEQLLASKDPFPLVAGLSLKAGKRSGTNVVQIQGADYALTVDLQRQGFPSERDAATRRHFLWLPADPVRGPELLAQLLQRFPPLEELPAPAGAAAAVPVFVRVGAPRERGLKLLSPRQVPLHVPPRWPIPFATLRWLEQQGPALSNLFQGLAQAGLPPDLAEKAHDFGVLLWPEVLDPGEKGPSFIGGISAPVWGPNGEAIGRAVFVNPFPTLLTNVKGAAAAIDPGAYQGLKESPDPTYVAERILGAMLHELAHQYTEAEGTPLLAAASAIRERLGEAGLTEGRDGIRRAITGGDGKLSAGYLAGRAAYYARARADRRPRPALGHEGSPGGGRALTQTLGGGGPPVPPAPGGYGGEPAGRRGEEPDPALTREAQEHEREAVRLEAEYRRTREWQPYSEALRHRSAASRLRRRAAAPTSAKDQFLKEYAASGSGGSAATPTVKRNLARTAGAMTGQPLDLVGFRHEAPGGRIPATGVFYGISPFVSQDYYQEEAARGRGAPLGKVIGPLASFSVEALAFENPLVINGGHYALQQALDRLPFSPADRQAIRAAQQLGIPYSTYDKAIARAAVRAGFDAILYRKTDRRYQGMFRAGSLLGPQGDYEERRWDSVIVDLRQPASRPGPKTLFQMIEPAPGLPEPRGKGEREGHRTTLFRFPWPGLDRQFTGARPGPKPTRWQEIKAAGTLLRHSLTRPFVHLPVNDPRWSELQARLREFDHGWGIANMQSVLYLAQILEELSPADHSFFNRMVYVLDLEEEVAEQTARIMERLGPDTTPEQVLAHLQLPQGDGSPEQAWTPERVAEAAALIRAELEKPENQAAAEAREIQRLVIDQVMDRLLSARKKATGKELLISRREWFHHEILFYTDEYRAQQASHGGKQFAPATPGFMRHREGSVLDYNSDYVGAMLSWLPTALFDAHAYEFMAWLRDRYDVKKELQKAALLINGARAYRQLEEFAAALNAQARRGSPVTAADLYRARYNAPSARGFGWLGRIAYEQRETLPGYDDPRWEDLVEEIAAKWYLGQEAADLGLPVPQVDDESARTLFDYLRWLLQPPQAGEPGSGAAAMIFKGIAEKKARLKAALGKEHVTWRDLLKHPFEVENGDGTTTSFDFTGYVAWQPEEGQALYRAWGVRERIANAVLESGAEGLGLRLSRDDLRHLKVVGGRKPEWVIPRPLALTLKELKNPVRDEFEKLWGKAASAAKQWILLNPFHYVAYHLRNELTDIEAVGTGNPYSFGYMKAAFLELYDFMWRGKLPSDHLRGWLDRGGVMSTLQAASTDRQSVGTLRFLRQLQEDRSLTDRTWGEVWRRARIAGDLREAVLRYASYLSYLDQMLADPAGRPLNFGASYEADIMAIGDVHLRAYTLSNDLLGAYDQVPALWKQVRKGLPMPFVNWKIVNTRRYMRLMVNEAMTSGNFHDTVRRLFTGATVPAVGGAGLPPVPPGGGGGEGGGGGGGGGGEGSDGEDADRQRRLREILRLQKGTRRFGMEWLLGQLRRHGVGLVFLGFMVRWLAKASWMNALAAANNWAFHSDEERRLPPYVRNKPHLDLGFNRYIDRISGFGDALGSLGLDDLGGYWEKWRNGRMSGWDVLGDMLFRQPVQTIADQVGLPKNVAELAAGVKFFPDFTRPRPIDDKWEYAMTSVGLGNAYRLLWGLPQRGGIGSLGTQGFGLTEMNPGESQYNEVRELAFDWARQHGFGDIHTPGLERSRNAYFYKKSLKNGDPASGLKFLLRYQELGGDDKGLGLSLKYMYPLYRWPEGQRRQFLLSMKGQEPTRWRNAMLFLYQSLAPKDPVDQEELDQKMKAPLEDFDRWAWSRIEGQIDRGGFFADVDRLHPEARAVGEKYKAKVEGR